MRVATRFFVLTILAAPVTLGGLASVPAHGDAALPGMPSDAGQTFPACGCSPPNVPDCIDRDDTYGSDWLQRDCSWTLARHRAEVSSYTVCLERCQIGADEFVRTLERVFDCRSQGLSDCN